MELLEFLHARRPERGPCKNPAHPRQPWAVTVEPRHFLQVTSDCIKPQDTFAGARSGLSWLITTCNKADYAQTVCFVRSMITLHLKNVSQYRGGMLPPSILGGLEADTYN